MQIEQVLARKGYVVHTIRPDSSLADASRLLIERDIGVLVCTDQTGGIVGILSERDLARALGRHGVEITGLRVSDVMTRDVVACAVSDTVEYLLTIMTETRCRHIPVVREGKLIGLVSIGDLVKAHLI